jgi:peptide/nickel transport system substrate-binding protein
MSNGSSLVQQEKDMKEQVSRDIPFASAAAGRMSRRDIVRNATALGVGVSAIGTLPSLSATGVLAQEATPAAVDNPFGEPQNQGGTAVIAVGGTGNPRIFIPTSYYGTAAFFVSKLVYTPLLLLDRTWGTIGPGLASAWEWNEDATALTLTLRDDVTFHDGTPFTAADVEFTYQLAIRNDRYFAVGDISIIQGATEFKDGTATELPGVTVVDDYTVTFTLTSSSNVLELNLSNCGILPKHLFGDDAVSGTAPVDEMPFFNGESGSESGLPVGTGPWMAVEYSPETNLTLARNEHYFLGAPVLDQVILRYGVEGPAIIAGLESGEFDTAFIVAEDAKSLEGSEILDLHSNHDMANETVLIMATEKEYLSVPVRQALLTALDKDLLIETITYGYAKPAPSIMMHPSLFPNDSLATYDYDPERAKQLLDEAGWDWDYTLKFGQFTATGSPTSAISAVMSMWNEIGLKVEFLPMDSAAQVDISRAEDHIYDVAMTSFAWLAYDPSTAYSSFASSRRPNYSNFNNPDFDEAMESAIRAGSLEEGVPLYQTAQAILQEELPYAPVWMDAEIWAVNKRMHGGMLGRGPLNNIQSEQWWKDAE